MKSHAQPAFVVGFSRVVRVGGVSKDELRQDLLRHGVHLNELGRRLFDDTRFVCVPVAEEIAVVDISVRELGFPDGATFPELLERGRREGLGLCSIDLAVSLRLQYLDQPEGSAGLSEIRHRAPPGSLTVVSRPLDDAPDFPKGFYLRNIGGVLWLRGYVSDDEHLWSPEDRLVFRRETVG